MDSILEIGLWRLLAAYIFLVLLLIITWRQGLAREKEIIFATFRMTLQLLLVGYLLVYIFELNHILITLLIFVFMEAFAIFNVFRRIKAKIGKQLQQIIGFSMFLGTTIPIFYFLFAVVNVQPWYEARYFIPLAGMLIGNSMTGITLGAERLINGMEARKDLVEGALMLGATPLQASRPVVNEAFSASIIPTINTMVGMGIVFLPGMMTGQILAGVSPLVAIEYQIAIMLGIMGSVSLTIFMLMQLGYKSFFNNRSQLDFDA